MIYKNVAEVIGHTPMIQLPNTDPKSAQIYVKLESKNPGGSIKDRPVKAILNSLLSQRILKKGGTIVEATSGNTGIALSMLGAAMGLKVIIVMPETMSIERRNLMQAYGAQLVLTPGSEGMQGAVKQANLIAEEKNAPIFGQFIRQENVNAHQTTTAPEILEDLPQVDGFVAGIGTGGTVTGIGSLLKAANSKTIIWGVEPASSPLLTEGKAGSHKIQGIGANFIPEILDQNLLDHVEQVSNEDAIQTSVELAKNYGILAGFSSGANLVAARRLAKELGPSKHVVTVLPDTGERYLSAGVFTHDE